MPNIPGIESINWGGSINTLVYLLKWVVYSIFLIGGMFIGYVFLTFNIKCTVFPMFGSGKDGVFSVQKKKWNRYKWNKTKTAWKPLLPPFNKKEVEPFDSEYLYPGNQLYAFELNGELIPGRINIKQTEKELRGDISPVPYYVRNWQSLQHKKNAIEYAKNDWWSENKTLMTALMAGIAILAAALIFVYLTYKMAGAGSGDIKQLANAIKGFSKIPGTPPGG